MGVEKAQKTWPSLNRLEFLHLGKAISFPGMRVLYLSVFIAVFHCAVCSSSGMASADSAQALIQQMKQDLYAVADSASDDYVRREVAKYFVDEHDFASARRMADKIDSAYFKEWFLASAIDAAENTDDRNALDSMIVWGLRAAAAVKPPTYQGDMLSAIARSVHRIDDKIRAESLLTAVVDLVDRNASYFERAHGYLGAAKSSLALGDTARAVGLLRETVSNVDTFYNRYDHELDLAVGYTDYSPVREYFYPEGILAEATKMVLNLGDDRKVDSFMTAIMHIGRQDRNPYPFGYDATALFRGLGEIISSSGNSLRVDRLTKMLIFEVMGSISFGRGFDFLDSLVGVVVERDGVTALDSLLAVALDRSDSLGDCPENVILLSAIPRAAARLDDSVRIQSVIARTCNKAAELSTPLFKSWALERIARALIDVKIEGRADSLLSSAVLTSEGITQLGERADLLKAVVYSADKLGDTALADSVFKLAGGGFDTQFRSQYNMSELQQAANGLVEHADSTRVDSVTQLMTQAMRDCQMLELQQTAALFLERGDTAWADSVIRLSIQAMRDCQSYSVRYVYVGDIAETIMKLDNPERRESLMDSLNRAIDAMADPETRSGGLYYMAKFLLDNGKIQRGDMVLRMAIKAAENIDSAEAEQDMLSQLAETAVEITDSAKAESALVLIMGAADAMGNPRRRAETLAGISATAYEGNYPGVGDSLIRLAIHDPATAKIIDTTNYINRGMSDIVDAILEYCHPMKAALLISEWLRAAERIDSTDMYKTRILRCVIDRMDEWYPTQWEMTLAEPLINEAERDRDARGASGVLSYLAGDQISWGDTANAISALGKALDAACQIPSDEDRSYLARSVAFLAASIGQIRTAYDAVYSINTPRYRVEPLLSALRGLRLYSQQNSRSNE